MFSGIGGRRKRFLLIESGYRRYDVLAFVHSYVPSGQYRRHNAANGTKHRDTFEVHGMRGGFVWNSVP
jgi:hypothetical protein